MLGQQTTANSGGGKKFTGPRQVKFLVVNPDTDQLTALYGKEPKKEPNYEIVEKNSNTFRPLKFYFRDTKSNNIVKMDLVVGEEVVGQPTDRDGNPRNYQVLTSNGSVTYACASGTSTPKPQFEDHNPLRMGEATLIALTQAMINYDTRLNQDYITGATEQKLTAKHLFDGDYSGYNSIPDDYPDNTLILTFTVQKDGDNYYQNVASDPKTIFADKFGSGVSKWNTDKLKERQESQIAAGYSLFREGDYYSFESQEFDSANPPAGGIPTNPQPSSSGDWNS